MAWGVALACRQGLSPGRWAIAAVERRRAEQEQAEEGKTYNNLEAKLNMAVLYWFTSRRFISTSRILLNGCYPWLSNQSVSPLSVFRSDFTSIFFLFFFPFLPEQTWCGEQSNRNSDKPYSNLDLSASYLRFCILVPCRVGFFSKLLLPSLCLRRPYVVYNPSLGLHPSHNPPSTNYVAPIHSVWVCQGPLPSWLYLDVQVVLEMFKVSRSHRLPSTGHAESL